MINPFRDVNWQPDLAARRTFGKTLVVGFPILAGIFLLVVRWKTGAWAEWPLWLAGIGAAIGLLCRAVPRVALPFYLVWYALACSVGIVVSNAIFVAVYYAVVTPVGLLLRVFGKDPLERRMDRAAATYWKDAEKVVDAGRYFRQF